MQKMLRAFLFWTLLLGACTASPATPTEVPSPTPTSTTPTLPPCGYQWAYQDLPELSQSFQSSIRALQAEAQAYAFAFGENCIAPDGSVAAFIPMETDFNITLQVSNLTDESALGEWVVKVMEVVTDVPPEQIVGPRPGRVSLIFQSGSEQQGINFYIDQFQQLPAGLSNAEIFQALKTSQ